MQPLEITMRSKIGRALELDEVGQAESAVRDMLVNGERYKEQIEGMRRDLFPHFGESAQIGGKYILSRLVKGSSGKSPKGQH